MPALRRRFSFNAGIILGLGLANGLLWCVAGKIPFSLLLILAVLAALLAGLWTGEDPWVIAFAFVVSPVVLVAGTKDPFAVILSLQSWAVIAYEFGPVYGLYVLITWIGVRLRSLVDWRRPFLPDSSGPPDTET